MKAIASEKKNSNEWKEESNNNLKREQHQMQKKTSMMQKEAQRKAWAWTEDWTLFYYGYRVFLGLMQLPHFFPLLMAYTLNSKRNPPSYPYLGKDLISTLDIKISHFFTLSGYYVIRSHNFEIQRQGYHLGYQKNWYPKKLTSDILSGIQSGYPNFQDIRPTLVSTLLFSY
jgi:hypothetical protein